jgi:beta-N-acetylhexosaminidase
MTKKFFFVFIATTFIMVVINLADNKMNQVKKAPINMTLEQKIAQKIMIDLRYYCSDMNESINEESELENQLEGYIEQTNPHKNSVNDQKKCFMPLTQLPKELAELIKTTALGGVILFNDNLVDSKQIIQLNSDLQNAALSSDTGLPLFISVDQEGGRVVRLPRDITTSFTGNMAIGATYAKHGIEYALKVGEILGSELYALGFNVDHAPDIDVNINANNPVINVRSFGEDPKMVADLGIAMLEGIQSQGIIATLKHFPGHGDTNMDSHTGLPVVNHNLPTVENIDLYPFQQAIDHSHVDMIMTAHIQYPALDNSVIVNKRGESMIKPATLSKKILTDLLRDKMGYKGLVVTDALDMAGISHFFSPLEAVLKTFKAGADIALMPVKIRKPSDIKAFKNFISLLTKRIADDPLTLQQTNASVERILKVKQKIMATTSSPEKIKEKTIQANKVLASPLHRQVELALAQNAIVEIKNNLGQSSSQKIFVHKAIQHSWQASIHRVHILFPQQQQSDAMTMSLKQYSDQFSWQISSSSLEKFNLETLFQQIKKSDLLIVASDSQKTAVELGGVDDLAQKKFLIGSNFGGNSIKALSFAKKHHKKTIFITLKTPYNLAKFLPLSDCVLTSFDGNLYQNKNNQLVGAAFEALAAVIMGEFLPQGKLPVSI